VSFRQLCLFRRDECDENGDPLVPRFLPSFGLLFHSFAAPPTMEDVWSIVHTVPVFFLSVLELYPAQVFLLSDLSFSLPHFKKDPPLSVIPRRLYSPSCFEGYKSFPLAFCSKSFFSFFFSWNQSGRCSLGPPPWDSISNMSSLFLPCPVPFWRPQQNPLIIMTGNSSSSLDETCPPPALPPPPNPTT